MIPPDPAWLPAVERWAGGPVTVLGRRPLDGGYAAGAVMRVDLDAAGRRRAVVVKRTTAVEVAAMRALAVVRGLERPALLAAGADWIVTPHHRGSPLDEGPDVPDDVWTALARVHAHWLRRRPRGLPVVDARWWRQLCRERVLPHVVEAGERTGEPGYGDAAGALRAWAEDPRALAALAVLPRTLVHGDAHRGNILRTDAGCVLIDWGNARVAPAGQDLAVLRAQGAVDESSYRRTFADLAGAPPAALVAVERHWGDAYAHVGYLGFAADHLGAARVAEMVDATTRALDALGTALAAP